MLVAELTSIGPAHDVVVAKEVPDLGAPAPGRVIVRVEACSINPADILMIEGKYAAIPEVPSLLGIEAAGVIEAVGEGVESLAVGDVVLSLARANWAEKLDLAETEVVVLPADIDREQAAMMKVNLATAWRMLTDYVPVGEGDWVIQSAANSGVGTNLIRLAAAEGIRTVNIVRRAELIEPLMDIGADVVVVDGPDLAERVHAATGNADIRLGIDAVAGSLVQRMGDCMSEGGVLVNYGLLSGEPCQLTADQVVFKGLTLTGFWLAKVMRGMTHDDISQMYEALAQRVIDGTISVPIEARYPLSDIKGALKHAGGYGRDGKVLLRPNG
jgi:NADPH:quinone reductase-like Zn-dependent oxidoreductase